MASNPPPGRYEVQAGNFAGRPEGAHQMGRKAAMDHAFQMHQIGHMQALLTNGFPIDLESLPPAVCANVEKMMAAQTAATSN